MFNHLAQFLTLKRARSVAIACAMSVAAPALLVPVVELVAAAPVSADPSISSDQAQISQIESTVQSDNQRLNALDEQYNEAQIRVSQDSQNVDAAKGKLQKAQSNEAATVVTLRREAVNAYIQGGNIATLGALVNGAGDNMAVRSYYLDQASSQAQNTVAQLRQQQHQISQEQAVYSQALSADKQDLGQVQADQRAAQATIASENGQLSQVKGNLAVLYQQQREAEQQAAQAAAAAAAAAAQRQAAADPVAGPAPPPNHRAGVAVQAALAQQGKPYIWGGAGPDGFDCSGLVMYAWGQAGVSLSHGSIAQYYETTRISAGQLEPGDLVFYSPPGDPPLGHVAMYIGNGEVVEANTEGTPVGVFSMYYVGPPVGYGRVS